jgi:hypothetical protein
VRSFQTISFEDTLRFNEEVFVSLALLVAPICAFFGSLFFELFVMPFGQFYTKCTALSSIGHNTYAIERVLSRRVCAPSLSDRQSDPVTVGMICIQQPVYCCSTLALCCAWYYCRKDEWLRSVRASARCFCFDFSILLL